MQTSVEEIKSWVSERIKSEEITKYMENGQDFIPEDEIIQKINQHKNPDPEKIREILSKSLEVKTLEPDEMAQLLNVTDPELIQQMEETALKIKTKVYDNRIVTFAPLYMGNLCVNNCVYCGFRKDNEAVNRGLLSQEAIRKETEVLAGKIGHKRLIAVFGEHPSTDVDYMVESLRTVYGTRVTTKNGINKDGIRRINVNAAPLPIDELRKLHEVGIGTYQVFQETYHKGTYAKMHPKGTLKSHYHWRLYSMHRAIEAGVDDVGIGALFGLYDWKFEMMGLLYHSRELEARCGVGPHTVSFPRLEPAVNTPFNERSPYEVSDECLKRIITILRLSIPHAGMIITAREDAPLRREAVSLGITQMDASTKIGIGAYGNETVDAPRQQEAKQQFMLGDTRTLDELIRELSEMGYITSFCTAGYRCGRTGECIMELLRSGGEGKFCKLNAVLTFREWLDDFASPETKIAGEKVLQKEIEEVKAKMPQAFENFMGYYKRIEKGERDIYL